jgi:hypothetical protein
MALPTAEILADPHHGNGTGIILSAFDHRSTACLIKVHHISSLRNDDSACTTPYNIKSVNIMRSILLKVFLTRLPSSFHKISPAIVVSKIPFAPIDDVLVSGSIFILISSSCILSVCCKNHCITTTTMSPILISPTAMTGANIAFMMFGMLKSFNNQV